MRSRLLVLLALLVLSPVLAAQDCWHDALKTMPLANRTALLNRSNTIPLLVESFRSNSSVKALVVLPAVTDDFYLINRDQPPLNLRAANVFEAITALTNATAVRVMFSSSFLLLHLDRDMIDPAVVIAHAPTADRLQGSRTWAHVAYCDEPWDRLQPALAEGLRLTVRPASDSAEGGHFYRVNLAGWQLTDLELLRAVALSSRTGISIERNRVTFGRGPRDSRGAGRDLYSCLAELAE